jgi:hypothetical protein
MIMQILWLGYDNLSVPYHDVVAVLLYQRAFDRRILLSYGSLPNTIRSIVVTSDGRYLPSSWRPEQLRQRLASWRISAVS